MPADLGRRLRRAREEAGLTQDKASQEVEIDQTTLSKWENGQGSPDALTVIRLADLYGVRLEWLATEQQPMRVGAPDPSIEGIRADGRAEAVRLMQSALDKIREATPPVVGAETATPALHREALELKHSYDHPSPKPRRDGSGE